MVFPHWQCYNFGLIPTLARQRLRLMTVAKVIQDGAFPARVFHCQSVLECGKLSVHAVCARVWHTQCSVCWCVDRLQATGLRPTWHRPAARASEPPKKRLLRQQRVEESLHSRTRARQLLLSSEKSLLRIPIPPSGIPAPSPSNSCGAETVV